MLPVQLAPTAVCQNGVMDYVLHPIEPFAVRLTVSGEFQSAAWRPVT
jgi:hypothetical protein